MFSASYFVFSHQPVSPPIFAHLRIRATPPLRISRTAGRGTSEESSSERGQLLQQCLRNHLPNLDRDTQLRHQWSLEEECKRRMKEERGKMKSLLHHGTSQIRQNWLRWEKYCLVVIFALQLSDHSEMSLHVCCSGLLTRNRWIKQHHTSFYCTHLSNWD